MKKIKADHRNAVKNIFGSYVMTSCGRSFYKGKAGQKDMHYQKQIFEVIDDYVEQA